MRYRLLVACLFSAIPALACSSSSTTIGPSGDFGAANKLPKDPFRVELDQVPDDCDFAVSATAGSAASSGGTFFTDVTTLNGCEWRASSNETWLLVSDEKRNSSGRVTITVTRNGGTARTGRVLVAGVLYTLAQSGVVATTAAPAPPSTTAPPAPPSPPPLPPLFPQ